ncbi:molybdate ABC transporter substrate-binding protein [Microlunatus sp. GCM10028923]|uniref:molybdate ABC transporter substrate-binding protein n=1 Tax=Microlunatus sp. GCM10028923 TaxID=3273400 RepID=UPI0036162ED6
MIRKAGLAAAVLLIMAVAGCAPAGSPSGAASSPAAGPAGELTVLAAASLTESFTTIGHDFEAANPGTKITFSFGSSATLATQVTAGAPADVFAAANESTMQTVADAGLATDPQPFVTNTLQIAVPPGNPAKITGLADFADPARRIALCATEVPCGAAAQQVFRKAGLEPAPDTLEEDVKAALQKVRLGEVDAALVYRTDVIAAGADVEGIAFDEAASAVNTYPICALAESRNPELAAAFVAHVRGPDGQAVLSRAGFASPS